MGLMVGHHRIFCKLINSGRFEVKQCKGLYFLLVIFIYCHILGFIESSERLLHIAYLLHTLATHY